MINTVQDKSHELSQEREKSYSIENPVGRGRKSVVYKAQPLFPLTTSDSQDVALKVMVGASKNPEIDAKRLKNEAISMLSCRHEHVIQLYDYQATGDSPYLSMEYAELGDLRSHILNRGKPLKLEAAIELMKQVASGLAAIHRVGIVHRDIKPENLLLTSENTVKIGDFGIAFLPTKAVNEGEANQGVGTFEYLAPESLEDGISNQSTDVYSAAITFYELISSELPFAGASFTEQIGNKMEGKVSSLAKHGIENHEMLDRFFQAALSSDIRDRYNTAHELLEALNRLGGNTWEHARSNVLVMRPRVYDIDYVDDADSRRDTLEIDEAILKRASSE